MKDKECLGLESIDIDKLSEDEKAIQKKIAKAQEKVMNKCKKGFEKLSKR